MYGAMMIDHDHQHSLMTQQSIPSHVRLASRAADKYMAASLM